MMSIGRNTRTAMIVLGGILVASAIPIAWSISANTDRGLPYTYEGTGRFNQQLDRGEVESARIFNSPHVLEVHLKDGSVEKFHWGGSAGIAIPPPEQALREHGVPYTVKQHLGSEYDPSSLALLIPLLGMVLLFLALPTKRRPSAAPAQPQAPSGA